MMDRLEIAKRVRSELETLLNSHIDFADTDSIAEHGLDSLGSVQLTLNLEDSFGVVFEDNEINIHHFATVESIVNLLEAKLT